MAQLFVRTCFALACQIFTVSAKLRCLGRGLAVAGDPYDFASA